MNPSLDSLRKDAFSIFQAGIVAADPYQAVKNSLSMKKDSLEIALDLNDSSKKLRGNWNKIHIFAFGKAACGMAKAAVEIIPVHYLASTPLAITNYGNELSLGNIEIITAGHPLPNSEGQKAAECIVKRLSKTKENELVLALISGGGSAMIPSPLTDISLEDKQITTDLLLTSGASIDQINTVRKHLSQLKGGHFARLASPATLHALILSDVLTDEISTIASGPTVPDKTTFKEAINILHATNIWNKTPLTVQHVLEAGVSGEIDETPKLNHPCFKNSSYTVIGSNSISLNAATSSAAALNYQTDIYSSNLSGEAKVEAKKLLLYASQQVKKGLTRSTAFLAGGETTVKVNGTGLGGRNQEMSLAFAIAAEKNALAHKWVFLSGGTDGRDGPTDAAGGIVDQKTISRLNKQKINPEEKLNNNDSYSALKESNGLVITGPTGTNVADLQILLIQPE